MSVREHSTPALGGTEAVKRPLLQEEGEVRVKNQVTVPKQIATALGLHAGDRVLFVIHENEPGEVHLYRMPESFAGIAPDAYGGEGGSAAFIRSEREAWEE
jgi:AbrB family looped-hinge helix DNA binding protein